MSQDPEVKLTVGDDQNSSGLRNLGAVGGLTGGGLLVGLDGFPSPFVGGTPLDVMAAFGGGGTGSLLDGLVDIDVKSGEKKEEVPALGPIGGLASVAAGGTPLNAMFGVGGPGSLLDGLAEINVKSGEKKEEGSARPLADLASIIGGQGSLAGGLTGGDTGSLLDAHIKTNVKSGENK